VSSEKWSGNIMNTVFSLVFNFLFIIIIVVLGMESRALHMLGKCSTTELYPEPFFFFLFNESNFVL
jgi:hypothetical protein